MRRIGTVRIAVLVAIVGVGFVAAACAPSPPASLTRVSRPTSLIGSAWQLVSMQGRQPPVGSELTLNFGRSGDVSGDGACNSFGGIFEYDASRGSIRIGNLLSTNRACLEPARNEVDRIYFQALGVVGDANIDPDGRLVLSGSGAELVFEVGPQSFPAGEPPSSDAPGAPSGLP
jgi:heat shock protein HslJ